MNYLEAWDDLLSQSATRNGRRKLENNTYLERRGENIAIRLHATDVVTLTPAYAELNTGGWFSMTTKARLNSYAPNAMIYSRSGVWYVRPHSKSWEDTGSDVQYFDGIRLDYDGNVMNPKPIAAEDAYADGVAEMKKRIKRYAALCRKTFEAGMPAPSGGDCWFCAMSNENGTLGDISGEPWLHLLGHMDEGYVVPSLLWNAIAEQGYPFPAYILDYSAETGTIGGGSHSHGDTLARAVRKYLSKRLVHAPIMR